MGSVTFPVKIPTAISGLYLRTPQATDHDAEGLSKIFSHKFNGRFEPERPNRAEPTTALYASRIPKWLEMAEKGQNSFCLIALAQQDQSQDDEIIGFGGFNSFFTQPATQGDGTVKVADVGVMLHEPFTGKGYGIASLRATIQAAFDDFEVDIVQAETLAINEPFRGLMKKLKLDQFATLRSENGLQDLLYSFTKAQWDSFLRGSSERSNENKKAEQALRVANEVLKEVGEVLS